MGKYVFTRLILLVLMTFVISIIVYYLTTLAMVMKWSSPAPLREDMAYAFESTKYILRLIFIEQDLGYRRDGTPYLQDILSRIPFSIKINVFSLLVYVPFGIGLGIVSALWSDTIVDHFISWMTLIFGSIPSYIVVFFLMMVFGFVLDWFPTLFMWGSWWNRYYIPIITLMLYPMSRIIRVVRSEILEAFNTDEVLLLRAKGLNQRQIVFRHLFRQSLVAVVPQIMELFLFVVMLSFIVEKTYQIPGMAKLYLDSIVVNGSDGNFVRMNTLVIAIITFFYTLMTLSMNLITDLTSMIIDPRISLYKRKRRDLQEHE